MSRVQCDIRPLLSHWPRTILTPMEQRSGMNSGAPVTHCLIVHHEEQARRSIRGVVSAAPGFDVVGEGASAEEALELAVALRPGLALVAVAMPGIDGFETSRRLVAALPATRVVLLFASVEPSNDDVVGSQAVAAQQEQALTPTWLRTLWNEHRPESFSDVP